MEEGAGRQKEEESSERGLIEYFLKGNSESDLKRRQEHE